MVNAINRISAADKSKFAHSNDNKSEERQESVHRDNANAGVVLELGDNEAKNATYKKPVSGRNSKEIERLWKETERATESLMSIVVRLVVNQGKKLRDAFSDNERLIVDTEARTEAKKMLSEDGELGVKAVSDRIVSFAKALSGGDKSKLAELKAGIEKGFRQAEEAFGGELPQICYSTYDEIMRKLDEWQNEE